MLDRTTKKRIDDLRDTLVGKLPDPKAQIEQITIALIYKFMDDMDREALELGGERKFFSGDYEKYAWDQLFDPKVKGEDQLKLYVEAIESMELNPNLPALFRDIFRNAFLPYRDPETLRQFLKTINEFNYDHSEKLGDAFEYLLSVMGSQGDAGQFRTPRHIIDFMVEIIDPGKHETVLDPACGTAGFLISSYKHIVKHNSSNFSQPASPNHHSERSEESGASAQTSSFAGAKKVLSVTENVLESPIRYKGDKLTADERKKLVQNITGYDISPDMVRMSLVNMYLHGFPDPNIEEYDTLTSEKKWDELADVVLANPPFMSPKGGIRPHQQFSIQSNRSEVLFVDYIAEHLSMNGRAAVIVPEGIIFQSATAYKKLRKMLVEENFLLGVISLPAGVFQPYSGVKTSILWMDKALAKKSDRILFVKVENDGFDLGAQRKPIKGNDLPEAFEMVKRYERLLKDGAGVTELNELAEKLEQGKKALLVEKEKLADNGEYNLSGSRYSVTELLSDFPIVKLGDLCKTSSGGTPSKSKPEYYQNGSVPWLKSGEVAQGYIYKAEEFITEEALNNSSAKIFPANTVLVAMYGATAGQVGLLKFSASTNQAVCGIYPNEKIKPEFLYLLLKYRKDYLINLSLGGAQPNISQNIIRNLEIPVPPLPVQEEIVAEINSYQKIIDGARQVVENYKPRIDIDPDWPMVELGEVCEVKGGKRLPKGKDLDNFPTAHPYIRVTDFKEMSVEQSNLKYINNEIFEQISKYIISANDVYISIAGTIGLMGTIPEELDGANLTENAAKLVFSPSVLDRRFLAVIGNSNLIQDQIKKLTHAVGVPKLALQRIRAIKIPLPTLEDQKKVVNSIYREYGLIKYNEQILSHFEQKIKDRIAKVWGEKKEETPKLYAEAEERVSMAAEE